MQKNQKAVALKYPEGAVAPFVTVNTKGELAKKVLQVAKENDIKIVQNEDLVNFLSVQEIGSCIPEQVWSTVAKIFAYVIKNT